MGSTPRASPQDSFGAVAGVDSLLGKDAPAVLLESWAGRHPGDAGEVARANGDQEAPSGFT
jgi:hypothetical protein